MPAVNRQPWLPPGTRRASCSAILRERRARPSFPSSAQHQSSSTVAFFFKAFWRESLRFRTSDQLEEISRRPDISFIMECRLACRHGQNMTSLVDRKQILTQVQCNFSKLAASNLQRPTCSLQALPPACSLQPVCCSL